VTQRSRRMLTDFSSGLGAAGVGLECSLLVWFSGPPLDGGDDGNRDTALSSSAETASWATSTAATAAVTSAPAATPLAPSQPPPSFESPPAATAASHGAGDTAAPPTSVSPRPGGGSPLPGVLGPAIPPPIVVSSPVPPRVGPAPFAPQSQAAHPVPSGAPSAHARTDSGVLSPPDPPRAVRLSLDGGTPPRTPGGTVLPGGGAAVVTPSSLAAPATGSAALAPATTSVTGAVPPVFGSPLAREVEVSPLGHRDGENAVELAGHVGSGSANVVTEELPQAPTPAPAAVAAPRSPRAGPAPEPQLPAGPPEALCTWRLLPSARLRPCACSTLLSHAPACHGYVHMRVQTFVSPVLVCVWRRLLVAAIDGTLERALKHYKDMQAAGLVPLTPSA
jgi:hypothetical protein